MRKTIKRLEPFTFFNVTAICSRLEKMAAKGWMIERIVNTGWVYRRMEPRKLHFAVSFYPKASEFDPEPSLEQQTFIDFCAHTGWQLACTSAQMQIFYNDRENPIPIETEPQLEVDAIHASVLKSMLPAYLVLFLIVLLQGGLFLSGFLGDPIRTLSDPSRILVGLCSVCCLILFVTELTCYFRWYGKAVPAAEQGLFLSPPDTARLQWSILGVVAIGFACYVLDHMLNGDALRRWILAAMLVYMALLFFGVQGMKDFLKKIKASRGVNRTLTCITSFVLAFTMMQGITHVLWWMNENRFSEQNTSESTRINQMISENRMPLILEDLLEVDSDRHRMLYSGSESLLMGQLTMGQRIRFDIDDVPDEPELEYRIVKVKLPFLYPMCKERLLYEQERLKHSHNLTYQEADPAPWAAEEAYRLWAPESGFTGQYLICYEDVLIELNLDWEPTEAQKEIVATQLGGL